MGLLQFNGNELISVAFARRNLLLGKRFVFPYKRGDIKEMRRKMREELDIQCMSANETIHSIESDEEYCVCWNILRGNWGFHNPTIPKI